MICRLCPAPARQRRARRGPQGRPAAARKALRAVFIGTTEVVPLHVFVAVLEGLRWVDSPVHVSCPYWKGCDGWIRPFTFSWPNRKGHWVRIECSACGDVASGVATKLQGLKPGSYCGRYSTTEVVPCYKSGLVGSFPQAAQPSLVEGWPQPGCSAFFPQGVQP
jgi:hypothetical protein